MKSAKYIHGHQHASINSRNHINRLIHDRVTEHPDVVQGMTDIYKSWITNYDIDGFRIDTVKHVNLEFWQDFVPEIMTHAAGPGTSLAGIT